ncbi:DNA primase [Cephaloticoccus primus]|uniref:DNA primase n=1 Tax=Cephaloticoccus primus TaxID=1548207 RepID=A0A139SSY5_9BACT|nr:DNA primase [Cephaloticoccus primus]KXU37581.1 DNA primase [Cephaloticoccus primus]
MPAIKPSCVRDLKLRVNIADVVSRVVTLRGAGAARLKGLCPFHNEKTPSFHVDTNRGLYKCFGCGVSGDIISFVRETEQLNFTEAVETLGQRFSIEIEYEAGAGPSREERSLRSELFELHDLAAAHYHDCFRAADATGQFMRRYWSEARRFAPELADEFKIGAAAPQHSPQDASSLAAVLLKKGFGEDALRRCGLFFIGEHTPISAATLRPRFRGRLMIPIRDNQGRVVAFTARQTELTPPDDPAREAKYINSPETPIFTKGQLLFNLDRARTAVGPEHPFVLVEGQLDAIRCWSVGLKTAVAPQGTAITDTQLTLLRRYHAQVECFFDSDAAGQKAALRFLPLALRAGLEARFLTRPDARSTLDPDGLFLERGLEAYEALHRDALSAMHYACRALLPEPATATAEEKSRAAREVMEIVAAADSQIVQSEFISEAAKHLHIASAAMQRDFQNFRLKQRRYAAPAAAASPNSLTHPGVSPETTGAATTGAKTAAMPEKLGGPADLRPTGAAPVNRSKTAARPEEHLLLICLHFEQLGALLARTLPHDWIDTRHTAGVLLNRFLAEFENENWPGRDHLAPLLETPEEEALVASLLFDSPTFDDPQKIATEALRLLRARFYEPRLQQIALDLARHDADSPAPPDPGALLQEQLELKRQLLRPLVLPTAV